jgi:hypothetical protein
LISALGFILTRYVAAQSVLNGRNYRRLLEKELDFEPNLLDIYINCTIGLCGAVFGFLDEIRSSKWVYYGQQLQFLTSFTDLSK